MDREGAVVEWGIWGGQGKEMRGGGSTGLTCVDGVVVCGGAVLNVAGFVVGADNDIVRGGGGSGVVVRNVGHTIRCAEEGG